MHQLKLLPQAQLDLEDVEFDGALKFGHFQAIKYRDGLRRLFVNLAYFPGMGTDLELSERPNWLKFPYGKHVVIYSIEPPDIVLIRRIVSTRTNWQNYI